MKVDLPASNIENLAQKPEARSQITETLRLAVNSGTEASNLDHQRLEVAQLTQAVAENATLQAHTIATVAERVLALERQQALTDVGGTPSEGDKSTPPIALIDTIRLQAQIIDVIASRVLALERVVFNASKPYENPAQAEKPHQGSWYQTQLNGVSATTGLPRSPEGAMHGAEIYAPSPTSTHFCADMAPRRRANKLTAMRAIDPSRIQLSDCHFYHSMTFPDGSEVLGDWDIRGSFSDYIGNIEVRGKTLLDVGTASGMIAFETERRGAHVTAYETPSLADVAHIPFKSNLYYTDHTAWVRQADTGGLAEVINSFWYAHHRFKSNVQVVYGDIFELADLVPPMDIVVAGAIIEHISDPIRAIEVFTKIAKQTIVLASTPVVESDELRMQSITQLDDPRFDYTWFAPSIGLLRRVLQNVGFQITKIGTSRQFARFKNDWATRPTIVAQRV